LSTSSDLSDGRRFVFLGLLLLAFMLGLALRLYGLDADSMWTDEIFTAEGAQLDLPTLLSGVASGSGRGIQLPLIYVIAHFSVATLGSSEFVLRLASMLVGSLSILLIYKLGRMLWSREVGLAAAFLLAFNPYHVQYSQEARHYALMAFLALMSSIFLIKAVQRNSPALWLGFVLSTVLGLYNHYFAFLLFAAQVAFAAWLIARSWFSRRSGGHRAASRPRPEGPTPRAQGLALLASTILVGVALLPWAGPLQSVFASPGGSAQVGVSAASLESSWSFWGQVLVDFSGVGFPALLIWLGAFVLGCIRSSGKANLLLGLSVSVPVVFLGLMEPEHFLAPKYVLYLLPLYLLVTAKGLSALAELLHRPLQSHWGERHWLPPIAQALPVLLLGALSVAPLVGYYRWEKEDWRSAEAYLHEHMAEGDIVVADGQRYGEGGDAKRVLEGLPYYFSLHDREAVILRAERGLAGKVQRSAQAGAEVWGVLYHIDDLASVDQLGEEVSVVEFANVAVVSLAEPTADLLEDTASILRALLLLQPGAEGQFELRLALAGIYHAMGRPEDAASQATLARDAAEEYQRQFKLDGSLLSRGWDWKPYWDLALTYAQLGMRRQAAMAYEETLSADPTFIKAYHRLASVYRQLNEPAKALATCQRGLDVEPQDAQLHFLLGLTYQGLGRVGEARAAYQEALRIDPDDESARRSLTLLPPASGEEIPHPLLRSLGLKIALLGYDLAPAVVEPGGTLDLRLWWQSVDNMARDYTAFVHLTGPDDQVWAQEDTLLLHSQEATSSWALGTTARSDIQLHLAPEAPAGEYRVMVGAYYWETGERLPVWDEDGQREPGDAIALGVVTVTPSRAED
jgi:tetratricopeptide (TPR) repeat protein